MNPSARFIVALNIKHYRNLLAHEADEGKRQTLLRLLDEEEAKLKQMSETNPTTKCKG